MVLCKHRTKVSKANNIVWVIELYVIDRLQSNVCLIDFLLTDGVDWFKIKKLKPTIG